MNRNLIAIIIPLLLAGAPLRALAGTPSGTVSANQAVFQFPDQITFQATLNDPAGIRSVVLEYGDSEQSCGQVVARAYPQFQPGPAVKVSWSWDMRQSGSLPPGASVWWRWVYTDGAGQEQTSAQSTVIWIDSLHAWQTLSSGMLRLHYYGESSSFAQSLLQAGAAGLARDEQQEGLTVDTPIDMYAYPNYQDLHAAVLYEPSWTGGMAYSDFNILLIGHSSGNSSWDYGAIVHELTHVVVGHLTFSCISFVPLWLNEGLAVYSEGPLDAQFQGPLDRATHSDQLLSVHSISGPFSEISDRADLSYAESFSLVNFLIGTYGQVKMNALLLALRDGASQDQALAQIYGFDTDGLEAAWRNAIGAPARAPSAQATAAATPTDVPTIVPVSGGLAAVTPTPSDTPGPAAATPLDTPASATAAPGGPPLSLTLMLAFTGCALVVVLGFVVLAFVLGVQGQRQGKSEDQKEGKREKPS